MNDPQAAFDRLTEYTNEIEQSVRDYALRVRDLTMLVDDYDKAYADLEHRYEDDLDTYDRAIVTALADTVEAGDSALLIEATYSIGIEGRDNTIGALLDYIEALETALLGPATGN